MLVRSVKVPPNDIIEVPVLPPALEDAVLKAAHANIGHGSWGLCIDSCSHGAISPAWHPSEWNTFIAVGCVELPAQEWASRPVITKGPWSVVIDTLDLGPVGMCITVH